MILPQNEVYNTIVVPQSEVFRSQHMILPQNEVNISVLLPSGIFRVVTVNWQLSNEVKAVIDLVGVKSIKNLTSTLVNGRRNCGFRGTR